MGNVSGKFNRLPQNMTFGLELEFTGGVTAAEMDKYIKELVQAGLIREGWNVHFDRSVIDDNGKGAEIVSPPLRDDDQTRKELELITNFIKAKGGYMGEKVGGHVHFGLQALGNDIEDIKNFFKLYTIFEPLLYKLTVGDLDHVRTGCKDYARPLQKRLTNVIDKKADSLTELMILLATNVGANPTHYGENRYYGLNIQRIVEALRNIPEGQNIEEYLQKMFKGEILYDENGKVISPTIEMRFPNGSSSADDILTGVRAMGGLLNASHNKELCKQSRIKTMYRKIKNRTSIAFGTVTAADRSNPDYAGLSDEEILKKKFEQSQYCDGVIDYNTFCFFMNIVNPNLNDKDLKMLYNHFQDKLVSAEKKMMHEIRSNKILSLRNMRRVLANREQIRQILNPTSGPENDISRTRVLAA